MTARPSPSADPSDDVLAMAAEMRRLAEAANAKAEWQREGRGVWELTDATDWFDKQGRPRKVNRFFIGVQAGGPTGATIAEQEAIAAYIAAVHPQAVLAVLDALAAAREALVEVAFGMHAQRQYMLMRGLSLIDGNEVCYKFPDGRVVIARAHLPQARADEEG